MLDTNVLISGVLLPRSLPAQAVRLAVATTTILFSQATWQELEAVLGRAKFDLYSAPERRRESASELKVAATFVAVGHRIHACRDPNDDKFLEVAVNGAADVIVTGDWDLLALNPFQGIAILTPADFLAWASA